MHGNLSLQRTLAAKVYPDIEIAEKLAWNHRLFTAVEDWEGPRFHDQDGLYEWVNRELLHAGPVDYLEFGVADGGTLRQWVELNQHPQTRFFGFDSFEGLPEDWRKDRAKGHFSQNGKPPEIADRRCQLIKGWFNESLPPFLASFAPQSRLVIHSDSDLYSSTLYTLAKLDPLLIPGSIIIFDEFFDAMHEFKALSDFCHAFGRTYKIVASTREFIQACIVMG